MTKKRGGGQYFVLWRQYVGKCGVVSKNWWLPFLWRKWPCRVQNRGSIFVSAGDIFWSHGEGRDTSRHLEKICWASVFGQEERAPPSLWIKWSSGGQMEGGRKGALKGSGGSGVVSRRLPPGGLRLCHSRAMVSLALPSKKRRPLTELLIQFPSGEV